MTALKIMELRLGIRWIETRYDDEKWPPYIDAVLRKMRRELSFLERQQVQERIDARLRQAT